MRRIYLALVGLGIVIGGIVVLSRPEPEPEYGGKKLSEWVDRYGDGKYIRIGNPPPVEDDPIYRIGTNGIPFVLRWLQYEQPAWKRSMYGVINSVLGRVNPTWEITDRRESLAHGSGRAFYILGPAAAGAVPELTRIANDPKATESASRAARALDLLRYRQFHIEWERAVREMKSNVLEKAAAP